jgi:hypothetical protein
LDQHQSQRPGLNFEAKKFFARIAYRHTVTPHCMMGVFPIIVIFALVAVVKASSSEGPFYFTQKVDHFSSTNSDTFQQKYYTRIGASNGPVFLYISGEAPLSGLPSDAVTTIYATHFNATIVTLEHRFYGSSLPYGNDFSTPKLALLTVEQALADLATFVTWFAKHRPVVTFGCSYAGAMSAWFRVRYPNVTVGSISSSGVVNPILDFTQVNHVLVFFCLCSNLSFSLMCK